MSPAGRIHSAELARALLDVLDDEALVLLAARLLPHLQGGCDPAGPQSPVLYTVDSLARAVELSPKTIRRAIRQGELAAIKRSGRWLISRDAVHLWACPRNRQRSPSGWTPSPSIRARPGASLRGVLCGPGRG